MTEKQLKEIAKRYFDIYPDRKVLYATEDGNIFLDRNPAVDHSVRQKIKWFEIERVDGEGPTKLRGDIDIDLEAQAALKKEAMELIDPDYKTMMRILRGLHFPLETTKKAEVTDAFMKLKGSLLDQAEKDKQAASEKTDGPGNDGSEDTGSDGSGEPGTDETKTEGAE